MAESPIERRNQQYEFIATDAMRRVGQIANGNETIMRHGLCRVILGLQQHLQFSLVSDLVKAEVLQFKEPDQRS